MFSLSFSLKGKNIKYFSFKILLFVILQKGHKITLFKKYFIHSASRLTQFVFCGEYSRDGASLLVHVYIAEV